MKNPNTTSELNSSREQLIHMLNIDLASVYEAIVAFIVYSQILNRTNYTDIAQELELHAAEDFRDAEKIAARIHDLGGTPCVRFSTVSTSTDPVVMMLSSIVRNHSCQIDMASMLGIGAAPSHHPAPQKSRLPRKAGATLPALTHHG